MINKDKALACIKAQVTIRSDTGCWEWTGKRDTKNYGIARVDGIAVRATRLSLFGFKGVELQPGDCACHHCDNPPCVNPDHLFVGTRSDNNQDSSRKGRKRGVGRVAEYGATRKTTIRLRQQDDMHIARIKKEWNFDDDIDAIRASLQLCPLPPPRYRVKK